MQFFSATLLVVSLAIVNANSVGRIVNGINAPPGLAPYHAHLLIRTNGQAPITHVGSGTLISQSHILTSASNVQNFGWWNAGLGNVNRANLQWFEANRAVAHPQFDHNTLNNNVAVIFLVTPIQGSLNIAPVFMPTINQNHLPMTDELGIIVGFGFTQNSGHFATELQTSFQRVPTNNECLNAFPHMQPFINNVFCGQSIQGNICAGDQGSGFVLDDFFNPTLIGIASHTADNCAGGAPGVYTRVNMYRDWIQQQTQIQW